MQEVVQWMCRRVALHEALDTPSSCGKHSAADSGKHAASVIEGGVRRKPETNVVRNGRRCGGGGCRTVDLQAGVVQKMVPNRCCF